MQRRPSVAVYCSNCVGDYITVGELRKVRTDLEDVGKVAKVKDVVKFDGSW